MKVLILTVTAGEGHNTISNAVCEYLQANGANTYIYDLYKGKDKFRAKVANDGYFLLCRRFSTLANRWYDRMKKNNYAVKNNVGFSFMIKRASSEVEKLISEFCPDVVVCTHLFCAAIVSRFKLMKESTYKSIYIVTDYDIYPLIETAKNIDFLVLPNKDMVEGALKKGFMKERILTFGIPVKRKFTTYYNKKEVRRQYSLSPDKFTVMIMSGGVGFSNSLQIIKNMKDLKDKTQIICVCGKNEKLRNNIDKIIQRGKYPDVLNLGYSENIDMLMSASDCIITKGGAATICESLSKDLPIILTQKLSWQERSNKQYLEKSDAVIHMSDQSKVSEYINSLIENPNIIDRMKDSIRKLKKNTATADIGNFILSLKNADNGGTEKM